MRVVVCFVWRDCIFFGMLVQAARSGTGVSKGTLLLTAERAMLGVKMMTKWTQEGPLFLVICHRSSFCIAQQGAKQRASTDYYAF